LTPKQSALIAALLTETTVSAAACKAGVSEATARRWLAQVAVANAYRDARRQIVEQALVVLQRATNGAVLTLLRNLSATTPEAVQVRAAGMILDYAVRAVEISDLAARVDQLEQLIAARRGAH
jgi:hypothetical protein